MLRLICFCLFITSIHAACHEHCQWCNETSNMCKECRHNLFLFNGTCVEECPDGYYEKVLSWDRTFGRMVGNICNKIYENTFVVGWGVDQYGGKVPNTVTTVNGIVITDTEFVVLCVSRKKIRKKSIQQRYHQLYRKVKVV